ncbi:MAG: 2-isopropylmalate synthase [Sulfurospirillum sp.]|nr:MAG: 2-isopropylmalate synthase [Sulfurospirillum sp.]
MDNKIVKIFDTTLRDGEQSPGASMNMEEKIQIALQLEKLRVDIIEAGFAAASPGDFEAIHNIAEVVENSTVCSLARALSRDIKAAGDAIAPAKHQRIHTFIATSPIHMKYKLQMSPDQVIQKAVEAVQYAKTFTNDVEFSCEDAGRSEMPFLKEILDAVIAAGATTLNIPDTVGYRMPEEMGSMIKELHEFVQDRAVISVHCHNDLGLAVANSLASIQNGARQIECTVNGLGERAGNAAMEEIVMALKTRKDYFNGLDTNIDTREIYPASRLVANITGIVPQPNKAIVGKNAFAHESGIHQDGVLKHQETYEIMKAEDIGLTDANTIVLGKLSGRHAFKEKIEALGYKLTDEELNQSFARFKLLADKKREIFDDDLRAIITDEIVQVPKTYELVNLQINDCMNGVPSAAVCIRHNENEITDAGIGNGTMDAIFKTVDRISGIQGELKDYKVTAVTQGKDALAKVTVKVSFDPALSSFTGHGLSIDTMIASAKAYISALNAYVYENESKSKRDRGGI